MRTNKSETSSVAAFSVTPGVHACVLPRIMAARLPRTEPSPDEDTERRSRSKAEQDALRRELRAAQQRRRRAEVQSGAAPQPSVCLQAILLLLFLFAGYDNTVAAEYWMRERKTWRLPQLPREALQAKIDELFLSIDNFDLHELADPQGSPRNFLGGAEPGSARASQLERTRRFARKRALAFLVKMRLADWVENANARRGVAPTTRLLIERYNGEVHALPQGLQRSPLAEPATTGYARTFALRWRRSVGARIGKLRVQDFIALEEKRAKAASLLLPRNTSNHFVFGKYVV